MVATTGKGNFAYPILVQKVVGILWAHSQRSPTTVLNLLSVTSETTFGLLLTNKIFSVFLRGETPAKVTSFCLLHR